MRWTKTHLTQLQKHLSAAYPEARCALDHGDPFQLVVATILSAQCTDARVNLTTPALFARYPDAPALALAEPGELETLIHATGFFRNKARNLIGLGQALMAKHNGQVPSDPKALGALPGVGQKTANVVLANAFGVPALAVDTHIFRVARRLGLSAANTPEKVEADLCRLFPRAAWIELHHQLIWHGRRTCDARKPACHECPVAELCPTGRGEIDDPHTGQPVLPAQPVTGKSSAQPLPGLSGGPQRIASLVPSVTELLANWGLVQRMVGRTKFCVEPKWIRSAVPALGGTKDPDIPGIVAQRPDLVILEKDENTREAAEALQAAGIPVHVLKIRSVAD
ncbi:MAG: endonuclease III, partial [Holophaga sp.]|nr:endonuclease III [Holophaga sp.]